MRTLVLVVALLCLVFPVNAQEAGPHGLFRGEVVTRWLDEPRRMQLVEDFAYVAPDELVWDAPAGWIIDGASIPRFAWSIVGGPYEGNYRRASVIHDVACDRKERPWKLVHRAFYTAMLAAGVDAMKAKLMYAAVYFGGPRWDSRVDVATASPFGPDAPAAVYMRTHRVEPDYAIVHPAAPPDGTTDTEPVFSSTLFFKAHEETLLTEQQFEVLRAKIEAEDLSLQQIEGYEPN